MVDAFSRRVLLRHFGQPIIADSEALKNKKVRLAAIEYT